MRIKKLKIDLTEYHGKPVGQKKGPEMDTSQPMKTMIDVLQVTYPNLSKERLHRVNPEKDISKIHSERSKVPVSHTTSSTLIWV